jgi:hypothetical protein
MLNLFDDFGGWESPGDTVSPSGRALAEFMSQRQSSVAAFIHNCFLVRNDHNSAPLVLHGAESPSDRTTEEPELSELVEYDGFD